MRVLLGVRCMVMVLSVTGAMQVTGVRAAGSQTRVAKQACGVSHAAPNEAEKALLGRRYSDAERLYGEELKDNPGSGKAMAGLVRAQLGAGKLSEALVQGWVSLRRTRTMRRWWTRWARCASGGRGGRGGGGVQPVGPSGPVYWTDPL